MNYDMMFINIRMFICKIKYSFDKRVYNSGNSGNSGILINNMDTVPFSGCLGLSRLI